MNYSQQDVHFIKYEEDPKTYREAIASRDAASWRKAINDVID
jgi:hypothetical protein